MRERDTGVCMYFGNIVANIFARSYLRNLKTELRAAGLGTEKATTRRIRRSAVQLFDGRRQSTPDSLSPLFFGAMSALVLATYRDTLAQTNDPKLATDVARKAGRNVFAAPTRTMVRAALWLVRDPMRALSGRSLLTFFPANRWSLQFTEGPKTQDSRSIFVDNCPYNAFFVTNGEPQLATILCEWDRLWMDLLNDSRYPIQAERPATLSTGAARCEFRLIREAGKTAGEKRDVIFGWKDDSHN